MPRRSVKEIKFKRRTYKRKKRDFMQRRTLSKKGYNFNRPETVIPGLFPQSKVLTLFYRGKGNITQGGGFIGSHVLRINSLYDLDYTGTGHQPIGRDELAARYKSYRVDSAVVKATFYSSASGNNLPSLVGIGMDKDATLHSSTDLDALVEHQRGKYIKRLLPNSREKATVTAKYVRSQFWPKKDSKDEDQHADFGANPTDVAYTQLWIGSTAALTSAITVEFEVWQRVRVFEPLGVASS